MNQLEIPKKRINLITKQMAAQRLSISIRTLDRMVSKGVIEKVFLGTSVRFRDTDIQNIIENGY